MSKHAAAFVGAIIGGLAVTLMAFPWILRMDTLEGWLAAVLTVTAAAVIAALVGGLLGRQMMIWWQRADQPNVYSKETERTKKALTYMMVFIGVVALMVFFFCR